MMLHRILLRWCVSGMLSVVPLLASAQDMGDGVPEEVRQSFSVDAIAYAGISRNEAKLDVFIQIPYEALTFVKGKDLYSATAEMTVSVYDSTNSVVVEKSWNETVENATFDETVAAGSYRLVERILTVHPGRYGLVILLRDLETKRTSRLVRQILVSDFDSSKFMLSDIMLVSRLTIKGNKLSVVPNVTQNMGGLAEPFYAYFDAYCDSLRDSVRFVGSIYTEKGDLVMKSDTVQSLHKGKNEVFLRVDHSALMLGDYRLIIRAFPHEDTVMADLGYLASTNRIFYIRWKGLPRSLKDLNLAIDQLRYIAKDAEFTAMKEAKTIEEKQKLFLQFWQKRSFNPNVPRNLRMEQYYARVEYANKHFSHYYEGWRTDMGMIYIVFGPPSSIDRHPFDTDSRPYEIWSYYELNYQFVFVDQTGFGDYRLTNPAWDVWARPHGD